MTGVSMPGDYLRVQNGFSTVTICNFSEVSYDFPVLHMQLAWPG